MNRSKQFDNSVIRTSAMFAIPVVTLMTVLVGCSEKPQHPNASSSASATAPTSTSEQVPAPVRENAADTLDIGTSGVRCLVGKATVACVTMEHKGMWADGERTFSFVRPKGGVAPGFRPGQHVENVAAGDLVLMTPGNCDLSNTNPNCEPFTIIAAADDAHSKGVAIGIISRVIPGQGLTICSEDTQFDIPIPAPAEAGSAVYRPNPGQQLNSGQSITVREWSFTLNNETLTISGPTGVTTVQV